MHKAFRRWVDDTTRLKSHGFTTTSEHKTSKHVDGLVATTTITLPMSAQRLQNAIGRFLPQSTPRTNVYIPEGGGVRGMLVGATMTRGRGVTRATTRESD
eukprot:4904793-Amphidinium_carterae.1